MSSPKVDDLLRCLSTLLTWATGSMVVATLYPSLHDPEVYVDPETFNPDRWLEGGEAEAAGKNWLVFGTGPHYCLGQTVRHSSTTSCA